MTELKNQPGRLSTQKQQEPGTNRAMERPTSGLSDFVRCPTSQALAEEAAANRSERKRGTILPWRRKLIRF
jgi:hypothetical protein